MRGTKQCRRWNKTRVESLRKATQGWEIGEVQEARESDDRRTPGASWEIKPGKKGEQPQGER